MLAAVSAFRSPQGTISVEIDDEHRDDVTLQIDGAGKQWQLDSEMGWSLQLKDGQYDIDVTSGGDRFRINRTE